jgi:hypothetical protein
MSSGVGSHFKRALASQAQNKDTQKVDSSNRCHAMTHQNADAMVLASARLRGIPPPLVVRLFNIIRGGECLSNAHWLGPWGQHFDDELRLRQNHWKIIGKTKKSGFCVVYSVSQASFFWAAIFVKTSLYGYWITCGYYGGLENFDINFEQFYSLHHAEGAK